jgi:hypothetical protein
VFLVDDILLIPARGLLFIFGEIHKQVMAEYSDKEAIYNKLRRLQYQFDIGEIGDATFTRLQNALVQQLETISEYEEEYLQEETDEGTNG